MAYRLVFPLILLSCGPQSMGMVQPPKISASASTTTPKEGDRISLTATATGGSGEYTYKWEQDSPKTPATLVGAFSGALLANTEWTVPSMCANQQFVIKLTVTDTNSQSASTTITIDAENQDSPFAIVSPPAASASTITAGETVTLSVSATSPGCGPTYAWSQTTPAPTEESFEGGKTTSGVTWRAPAVAAATQYTLGVVVTAPDGATQTPTAVTVTVNPPAFAAVKSVLQDRCDGCHDATAPEADLSLNSNDNAVLQGILGGMAAEACGTTGSVYVVPGDLDNSVLWRRVSGTGGSGCDSMPRGDTGYFSANKNRLLQIKSWIMSGASYQ